MFDTLILVAVTMFGSLIFLLLGYFIGRLVERNTPMNFKNHRHHCCDYPEWCQVKEDYRNKQPYGL